MVRPPLDFNNCYNASEVAPLSTQGHVTDHVTTSTQLLSCAPADCLTSSRPILGGLAAYSAASSGNLAWKWRRAASASPGDRGGRKSILAGSPLALSSARSSSAVCRTRSRSIGAGGGNIGASTFAVA